MKVYATATRVKGIENLIEAVLYFYFSNELFNKKFNSDHMAIERIRYLRRLAFNRLRKAGVTDDIPQIIKLKNCVECGGNTFFILPRPNVWPDDTFQHTVEKEWLKHSPEGYEDSRAFKHLEPLLCKPSEKDFLVAVDIDLDEIIQENDSIFFPNEGKELGELSYEDITLFVMQQEMELGHYDLFDEDDISWQEFKKQHEGQEGYIKAVEALSKNYDGMRLKMIVPDEADNIPNRKKKYDAAKLNAYHHDEIGHQESASLINRFNNLISLTEFQGGRIPLKQTDTDSMRLLKQYINAMESEDTVSMTIPVSTSVETFVRHRIIDSGYYDIITSTAPHDVLPPWEKTLYARIMIDGSVEFYGLHNGGWSRAIHIGLDNAYCRVIDVISIGEHQAHKTEAEQAQSTPISLEDDPDLVGIKNTGIPESSLKKWEEAMDKRLENEILNEFLDGEMNQPQQYRDQVNQHPKFYSWLHNIIRSELEHRQEDSVFSGYVVLFAMSVIGMIGGLCYMGSKEILNGYHVYLFIMAIGACAGIALMAEKKNRL